MVQHAAQVLLPSAGCLTKAVVVAGRRYCVGGGACTLLGLPAAARMSNAAPRAAGGAASGADAASWRRRLAAARLRLRLMRHRPPRAGRQRRRGATGRWAAVAVAKRGCWAVGCDPSLPAPPSGCRPPARLLRQGAGLWRPVGPPHRRPCGRHHPDWRRRGGECRRRGGRGDGDAGGCGRPRPGGSAGRRRARPDGRAGESHWPRREPPRHR